MPIHDWTRVSAGGFHYFHQDWTIEICRTLNGGLLPEGYSALTDLRVVGWEPDVVAIRSPDPAGPGGLAVADAPPKARLVSRVETDAAVYARKANRIVIRHEFGDVVAVIEIVSPGNKDSAHAIRSFKTKLVEFLGSGVSLLVVDLIPPTPRDPNGIHAAIWAEFSDVPPEAAPTDKPLTVAAYDARDGLTAYVNPVQVGDSLPDAAVFLARGWYVNLPLERTYQASWAQTPPLVRNRVAPPLPGMP